jgi:hypothetical protein
MAHRSSKEREQSAEHTNTDDEDSKSKHSQEKKSKPPGKKPDLFLEYFSKFRDA